MVTAAFELLEQVRDGVDRAQRLMAFWSPVASVPSLLAPFFALAAVVALAVLSGVAIGALATLLVALVALYLLLTEVFGITFEPALV